MIKTIKSTLLKQVFAVLFVALYAAVYATPAYSAVLTTTSITLGDPRTGLSSTYTAAASGVGAGTIGCVDLDLGSAADGSGAIAGINTGSSTLDSFSLTGGGGWVVDNSQSGSLTLRATNPTPAAGTNGSVTWGAVTNGSTENVTYYGVLTTYTDNTCATPVDTATMTFVYKNGELVTLTIDPSLTFSCAGVALGQDVFPSRGASSINTTVLSNASGIDHASTVNSTTNGISAHDLTTTTNASGGFNVYIRHTGLLTNGASDTIATGGLSDQPFTAPGVEGWAWTTDDNAIGTHNDTDIGNWTSFLSSNALVATEGGVATTTDRVGHQVGVAGTTPAGTYTTTIIYTAVAIY